MFCSVNTATVAPPEDVAPPKNLVQAIAEELSRSTGDPLSTSKLVARRLLADALAETTPPPRKRRLVRRQAVAL